MVLPCSVSVCFFCPFSILITLQGKRELVFVLIVHLGRAKRIWYLSPMRAAKVQASLRIRAVSPEPSLLAHTSSESRRTFRQKARSLAPLNSWACAVKICHDGMLEDTNSLDGAHLFVSYAHVDLCHFFLLILEVGCDFCLWLSLDFSVYLLTVCILLVHLSLFSVYNIKYTKHQ